MSEEEKNRIAAATMFELASKKKELACLKAKAYKAAKEMEMVACLLNDAAVGRFASGSVIQEDVPVPGGEVGDLLRSLEGVHGEVQLLQVQLKEMGRDC